MDIKIILNFFYIIHCQQSLSLIEIRLKFYNK